MDWIKNVTDGIKGVFEKVRLPITPIPPILLLCEIMNRPGLSALALTGAVIGELEKEGIPTGETERGEPNYNNKFVKIFAEEFIKHVKMSGVTQMVVPPGDISFIGMGGNAGGPVTLTLINNNMGEIGGIVE